MLKFKVVNLHIFCIASFLIFSSPFFHFLLFFSPFFPSFVFLLENVWLGRLLLRLM